MVNWDSNEAGTVHRAQAAVRGSRFLRSARIAQCWWRDGEATVWMVTIHAKTDMDAPINVGLEPTFKIIDVKHFDTLRRAKTWAETWLQP